MVIVRLARMFLLVGALSLWPLSVWAQSIQVIAPAAYLHDVGTNSPLYEKKADDLLAPASIVKLLTAETVFHALKSGEVALETEYLISENTWRRGGAPSGSPAMFAPLKSRVAIRDLLQGLIVSSANDAALALAEGMLGGEAAFVARMQERARVIGLTRSQFRTATGFSNAEQRVTAREMALLARHVIETYPERLALFGQREFSWNAIFQRNRNPLIAMNIGADGLATGNTTEAGFNLVGTAQRDGRRLIVVILGAENAEMRATEARKLLDWGFSNFEPRKLLEKDIDLIQAKVSGGSKAQVALGLKEDITLLLPKSILDPVTTSITYQGPLQAPIAPGAVVGRLIVRRGNVIALQAPVIALEGVEQGSLAKRALDNSLEWVSGLFRRSGRP